MAEQYHTFLSGGNHDELREQLVRLISIWRCRINVRDGVPVGQESSYRPSIDFETAAIELESVLNGRLKL